MKKTDVNKIRKKKKDEQYTHRHVFYLNDEEHEKLIGLFSESGRKSESRFLANIVTEKPIKIVKIDKTACDYYIKLTYLYTQFQAIGTNYNQLVKALKSNFSEKRAIALLFQLEKNTTELYAIFQKVIELTNEFSQKWLQK